MYFPLVDKNKDPTKYLCRTLGLGLVRLATMKSKYSSFLIISIYGLILPAINAASFLTKFSIEDAPVLSSKSPTKFTLADCPCSSPDLCKPIIDIPDKEVFVFSIRNDNTHWERFDWSKLTTVVVFGYVNETLMCLAHSHNVRVVILGDVSVETFTDPAKRQQWIQNQLLLVKQNFLDGLNFDFEGQVGVNDSLIRDAYTELVQETSAAFKQELPYSQISVDIAWKPNTDIRFFDYQGLALAADLLFVMAYDEQSQIFGECVAGPNSAYMSASAGLDDYLNGFDKKIPAHKLILGVPWYGYIYECTSLVGDKCYIREVPFRGVNCSDAAGSQHDYGPLYQLIQTMPEKYRWNATSLTPYITYTNAETGLSHQIQFDDPRSLKLKYDLAAQKGLRGVGMWNIDALDYSDSEVGEEIRREMFGALPPRTYSQPHARRKSPCPCMDSRWCEPIKKVFQNQVFIFSTVEDENHWQKLDWSKITTVIMHNYVNTSLMCLAHSHNIRVVMNGKMDETVLLNPRSRQKWIADQVALLQNNFLDGINIDFSNQDKELHVSFSDLIKQTLITFKKVLPHVQISIDVHTDMLSLRQPYDYSLLVDFVDYIFVKAIDKRFHLVVPSAGVSEIISETLHYLIRKIRLGKLVLVLPWYGYLYDCLILINNICSSNPTRAKPMDYNTILAILETMLDKYKLNMTSKSIYFSYTDVSTNISQVHFEDARSLKIKYDLAADLGLGGVGMWTVDFLVYSDTERRKKMRGTMFGALPSTHPATSTTNDINTNDILGVPYFKSNKKDKYAETYMARSQPADGANTVLCPCENPRWCEPIKNTSRKEVYAFSIVNNETHWNQFDWSKITTVCMFNYVNPLFMCLAHSHNVKVVTLGAVDLITMITPTLRQQWVAKQLQIVKDNFLDGLNFDVEMNISPQHKDLRDAYTALVNETVIAFKQALPYSQISIDVQGDALTTSRSYDYPTLAKLVDFFFIMAYDESGFDVVGPNSGAIQTTTGVIHYFQDMITPDKLVLGLPWYGYIYFCSKLVGDTCYLSPTRAEQVDYNTIAAILETMPDKYKWNITSETPYFSYTDVTTNISHQVQFDDDSSLKIKYNLAVDLGLRGVGMWTVDFLDYSHTARGKKMRDAMFGALPSYT